MEAREASALLATSAVPSAFLTAIGVALSAVVPFPS
jgi:hypothetical protein